MSILFSQIQYEFNATHRQSKEIPPTVYLYGIPMQNWKSDFGSILSRCQLSYSKLVLGSIVRT